jgi:hypothetical protein
MRDYEHMMVAVEELKNIKPDIDYETEIKRYKACLEEQDIQTQEMQLSIYPWLISIIRDGEEKSENDD